MRLSNSNKQVVMRTPDRQQNVKQELNETLSNTIKLLQQEIARSMENAYHVGSDSDIAQHFINILEAAFVHGLKLSSYEKRKHSNELPRPQFWNLILKISHKDTLNEIKKLSFIRTRIGHCRAWLRQALNDASLSSYLHSVLYSADFKSLLHRYYEPCALFRDHEQADIFLRYLQGAENFAFDLSCNSSMLNAWTRTPLEIADIITARSGKRTFQFSSNNFSSPFAMKHSLSWQNLRSETTSTFSASSWRDNSSNSVGIPLSSSPTPSWSSLISASLPSIQVYPTSEAGSDERNNLVEVLPDAGQAPSSTNNGAYVGAPVNTILHRRHLIRRRSARPPKNQQGDDVSLGSQGSLSSDGSIPISSGPATRDSRCSSFSSVGTSCSGTPCGRTTEQNDKAESTPSGGDHDTKFTEVNLDLKTNQSTEPVNRDPVLRDPEEAPPPPLFKNETLKTYGDVITDKENTISLPDSNSVAATATSLQPPHYTNETHDDPSSIEGDQLAPPSNQILHRTASPSIDMARSSSTLCPEDVTQSLETIDGTIAASLVDGTPEEEIIDIYARKPANSFDAAHESDDETSTQHPSPGVGNSLLCGIGWSSDHTGPISPSSISSSPQLSDADDDGSADGQSRKSTLNTIVHREGYLQKKGDTIFFWRTRWFVLDGNNATIIYYKDKKCEEELGVIQLSNVVSINEDNIKKYKSISLIMRDETEHEIAAESNRLIVEWTTDISKVVGNKKKTEGRPTSPEEEFEILESNAIPTDHLLSGLHNTSWIGAMQSHMTKIANEKGLDMQNYQCADCASPIGMIYGTPRVCSFTGQCYCAECHLNEQHVIPARMIHNWDFSKYAVAKRSRRFLEDTWYQPCIEMDRVNYPAYRHIADMKRLLSLRLKLHALQLYLTTCRLLPSNQLNSKLKGRRYMLSSPHIYSAFDIQKARGGELGDVINRVVTFGTSHVKSCSLCMAKGFVCEVCHRDEIIFPFDTDTTLQCGECMGVYHKDCLPDISACPKCHRRHKRMKIEEAQLFQSGSDDDDEQSPS